MPAYDTGENELRMKITDLEMQLRATEAEVYRK